MKADMVLDLDALLGKARNRITGIGVELEGLWNKVPRGTKIDRDGSVRFAEAMDDDDWPKAGEIPSPVLRLAPTKLEPAPLLLDAWVPKFYPHAVNATCGMHVHMSFRSNFHYQKLMDERLMWTIVSYFDKWAIKNLPADHCIFDRLAGKSEYCKLTFSPDAQVAKKRKEYEHNAPGCRYTVMNYCWGTADRQTMECRLLPMMPDAAMALKAIHHLLDIVNAFLVKVAERERPIAVEIPSISLVPEVSNFLAYV